jgi:hypothetical protein
MNERLEWSWPLRGQLVEAFGPDLDRWARCENELLRLGVSVPLVHRSSWKREVEPHCGFFLVARSAADSSLSAAVPIEVVPTRSLPGHRNLQVSYFGYAAHEEGLTAALEGLARFLAEDPRSLGVRVQVFLADDGRRDRLERQAADLGYERARRPTRYGRTLRLELSADEDTLLGSFAATCRRFIRAPEKKGFSVRLLDDPRWAHRMNEVWRETFARTGARPPERRWSDLLTFANRHPAQYRIVGTFGPDYPNPRSLSAFACAMNNSDHALYADGASSRDVSAAVPLSYALMWDLIRWSKSMDCEWFDFGGITDGHYHDGDDVLGGISDFKRRFTERVICVGSEWELKPPSWRTALSDRVSASGQLVRRLASVLAR